MYNTSTTRSEVMIIASILVAAAALGIGNFYGEALVRNRSSLVRLAYIALFTMLCLSYQSEYGMMATYLTIIVPTIVGARIGWRRNK